MTDVRLYGLKVRGKFITNPNDGFQSREDAEAAIQQLPASDIPYAKVVPYIFDGTTIKKMLAGN